MLTLILDGGGTSTEVGIFDAEMRPVQRYSLPSYKPLDEAHLRTTELAQALMSLSMASAPQITRMAIGMSGLGDDRLRGLYHEAFLRSWKHAWTDLAGIEPPASHAVELVTAHDLKLAHMAAFGNESGVVVVSGTGSGAYAVGPSGTSRCGGWGPWADDGGSGYAIGRAALRAAARHLDKRDTEITQVAAAVTSHYIDGQAVDLLRASLRSPLDPRTVASVAMNILDLAGHGDLLAARIIDEAAKELSDLALTLLTNDVEHSVAFAGSIATHPVLVSRVEDAIRRVHPDAQFRTVQDIVAAAARQIASMN
jgi:N-acetylglucosamine kinase-like BadF-type ATPase